MVVGTARSAMLSASRTRSLNRAGLSSDYDVLRLEVELANLEPELRRAENEFRRMQRDPLQVGPDPERGGAQADPQCGADPALRARLSSFALHQTWKPSPRRTGR